jgi:hypothetical protein
MKNILRTVLKKNRIIDELDPFFCFHQYSTVSKLSQKR